MQKRAWAAILLVFALAGCYERGVVPDPNAPVPEADFSEIEDRLREMARAELLGEELPPAQGTEGGEPALQPTPLRRDPTELP